MEDGRDGARPSRGKPDGGPCSVMAAPWRAMVPRGRKEDFAMNGPEDGRDGARPSRGKPDGGPCSVMAAPWSKRRSCRDEAQRRTRRSASLHGTTHGGPRSLVAARGNRAMTGPEDGRDGARPSMEQPDGGPRSPVAAGGNRAMTGPEDGRDGARPSKVCAKTDATERVPPGDPSLSAE